MNGNILFCWEERFTVRMGREASVFSSCCPSLVQGLVMALIWLKPDGWVGGANEIFCLSFQALQSTSAHRKPRLSNPLFPSPIPLSQETTHGGMTWGHNP